MQKKYHTKHECKKREMIISLINTIILTCQIISKKETEEDNHQTEYSDNDVTNVHYHAND